MKKWTVLLVALLMVAGAQAGEKGKAKDPVTKAQFIAAQQKKAEAGDKTFDQAKCEAAFAKKDTNKDGVLSAAEMKSGGKNKDKKGKSAE